MQTVRGGDDHALGPDLVHHGRGIGIERHTGGLGRSAGTLKGIGDGYELGLGLLDNKTNVVAAHSASANDGNAHGSLLVRHGGLLSKGKTLLPSSHKGGATRLHDAA